MAAGLDGDIKIGLDLNTKSAGNALDSFRKKVKDSLSGTDVKGLEQNIKNTEKEISALEKSIDKTKQKLQELSQSATQPKSVTAMEKELAQLEKQLDKANKEFEKLAKEQQDIVEKGVPTNNGMWYSSEDKARFTEIENTLEPLGQTIRDTESKIEQLKTKLSEVKGNPELTAEGKKYNKELDDATRELEEQKKKLQELRTEQSKTNTVTAEMPKAFQSFGKVLTRIKGLIKRVFFFTIITKFLRALRTGLSGIISQNNALSSSLNQIKGNLLTAFAPIWQTILPWLQTFLNVLAKVTAYLAAFINMLLGKSVKASQAAAKALQQQASAAKASGGATKKATEEAEKSSLSFDTLNTIATPKEDTSGGGGGGGATTPVFETTDLTLTNEIEKKLQSILVLVGSIGGALLAWKIYTIVSDFINGAKAAKILASGVSLSEKEFKKLNEQAKKSRDIKGMFKKVAGIAMIVAGAILLVKGYMDAWVNGIDWSNFLLILGGVALLIGGIALAVSPAAAAFAAIGAGIAMVVLGVKDFIENGASFQNILMIIIGLAAIFAAVWSVASAPIALIVVAIAALIAIFVLLWNKCEGFRNFWIDLWEKLKETATSLWEDTLKPLWEEHLKPAIEAIWQKLQELWEQVIQPILNKIGETVKWLWDNILSPLLDWVTGIFVELFKNAFDTIMGVIQVVVEWFGEKIDAIKTIFTGLIDFVVGVFTGDWGKALGGIKTAFSGIIDSIKSDFKAMINLVINMINGFIRGVNLGIDVINNIPGVNIPVISEIPPLAQGAVLPPNKPFAAIVGDQKHGTNIEAPLDTIVEAVMIALSKTNSGNNNGDININFTGNLSQLARVLNPVIEREKKRGSTKLVKGGAH